MYLDPNRFDVIPFDDLSPENTWKRIGQGSFGRVFLGDYLGLSVAIKEVFDSNEYDVQKYFQRELTIMQESRHPNIVQYVGLCVAPPAAFDPSAPDAHSSSAQPRQRILIISEFLRGGNVRHYIAASNLPFPWRLRMSFCVDAARALTYMHARKCMHRDLKGENMLLTENQRVKVCDFGFARIAARNAEEMRRISFCGTDGYMSPEILMGADFGLETDIFSLGIIFCEILTRTLVDSDTMARVPPMFGIDEAEVRSLASPGCPPEFIDLALHCCQEEPSHRPTIRQVLDRLRVIEQQVLDEDQKSAKDAEAKTYHIGSLNFGGKLKTKKQLARPSMAGRMPSFEGAVKVPHQPHQQRDSSSSGDEAIEDVLAALEDVQVEDDEDFGEAAKAEEERPYSTMVIGGRGSKNNSSSFAGGSSILTVKAEGGHVKEQTHSSVPSLPESWLAQAPEAAAIIRGEKNPTVSKEDEVEQHPATESLNAPQSHVDTSSSVRVVINGETDDVFFSAPSIFDQNLHRFSLVRPGWKLFTTSESPTSAINMLKQIRKAEASGEDPKATSEMLLRGNKHRSGLELNSAVTRCEFCRKRTGWMKPHLVCDDCGFVCHVACGDIAPRSCGVPPDEVPELNGSRTKPIKR